MNIPLTNEQVQRVIDELESSTEGCMDEAEALQSKCYKALDTIKALIEERNLLRAKLRSVGHELTNLVDDLGILRSF